MTEALEQRRILELVGSVEGTGMLDLGCGDGLLTTTLATRGARAVGIDIDRCFARLWRGRIPGNPSQRDSS